MELVPLSEGVRQALEQTPPQYPNPFEGIMQVPHESVPSSFVCHIAEGRDNHGKPVRVIKFILSQPTGMTVAFFDPDATKAIAEQLLELSRVAKSGLTVPGIS